MNATTSTLTLRLSKDGWAPQALDHALSFPRKRESMTPFTGIRRFVDPRFRGDDT
jgi:hypothetical protein